eukprot:TRINITY_DN7752_c0_g1_i13.p1 TRINITY_DN7752_c0_g1~~TRINITY_DN7752_c0_g1_i13.p1  ORF type:complete len:879 (+),score=227.97 TRINITY_DN7752_c0_g1_i13:690-3326(+)
MEKMQISLGSMIEVIEAKFHIEYKTLKLVESYFYRFQGCLRSIEKFLFSMQELSESVPESSYTTKMTTFSIANKLSGCIKELHEIESFNKMNIINSIKKFAEEYREKHKYFGSKKKEIISELLDVKSTVEKCKKKYFRRAKKVDSPSDSLVGGKRKEEADPTDPNAISKRARRMKKLNRAVLKYKKAIIKANERIIARKKEYEFLAEMMLQYDESRSETFKNLLERYQSSLVDLSNVFFHSAAAVQSVTKIENLNNDSEVFVLTHKNQSTNPLFSRLHYEKYPYKGAILELLEDDIVAEKKREEKLEERLQDSLDRAVLSLVNPEISTSIESKIKLMKNMGDIELASLLTERLSSIDDDFPVTSVDAFNNIADIINSSLNSYRKGEEEQEEMLIMIIRASRNLYLEENGDKKYLHSLIASNLIWQSRSIWKSIIQTEIRKRIEASQPYADLAKQKDKASRIKIPIVENPTETPEEAKLKIIQAKTVDSMLAKYADILPMFRVSSKVISKTICYFGRTYNVDMNKIREAIFAALLTQPLVQPLTPKKDLMKKYKGNVVAIMIIWAIPYIRSKATLRNVLLLRRDIYNCVKKKIFNKILLENNLDLKTRGQIWSQILDIHNCDACYEDYIKQIRRKDRSVSEFTANLIKMDVERTFRPDGVMDPKAILDILLAYSCYNCKISYCQGMNFIAGLLFRVYQDEATAFKAFVQLIKLFNLSGLYVQDIPLLKRFLFQLNRLVSLFLPKLSEHLKNENFGVAMYATTWFMTLFAHVFGYLKEDDVPEGLLVIWDEFLIHGWKTIFKAGIFILSEFEEKLLKLKFEEIAPVIGNMTIHTIFESEGFTYRFKMGMRKVKVTSKMLAELEKEYNEAFTGLKELLESS